VLTRTRGAAAGAIAAVALVAVASTAPASATPAASSRGSEVVGGPDLGSRGIVVRPAAGSTPLPAVGADTWLVADLTTGQVLAAKGAHTRVLPASTLKTLTSVTLMPKLDRSSIVTASEFDVHADGSHVGLVVGGTYTVWDLWNGLLLPSANDAAAALSEANGGFGKTVAEMAAMAHHLQANDTTPKTPSGLDTPGQYSSGGKTRLGRITKAGDRYLRSLLVMGARAVLSGLGDKQDRFSRWARSLVERRGYWKAVVAIAAKNARLAWAVLKYGEDFRLSPSAA